MSRRESSTIIIFYSQVNYEVRTNKILISRKTSDPVSFSMSNKMANVRILITSSIVVVHVCKSGFGFEILCGLENVLILYTFGVNSITKRKGILLARTNLFQRYITCEFYWHTRKRKQPYFVLGVHYWIQTPPPTSVLRNSTSDEKWENMNTNFRVWFKW